MSALVNINCPFCGMRHVACPIVQYKAIDTHQMEWKPRQATMEAVGVCGGCKSYVTLFFWVLNQDCGESNPARYFAEFSQINGDVTNLQDGTHIIQLVGVLPERQLHQVPAHLPDNVERAMVSAEKAWADENWSLAAAGYRKTVERAVGQIAGDAADVTTLGRKLGRLEKGNVLPEAMLDWIRVVKDDGNFALHDDDRDFDSAEEVAPARRFTQVLLEYLFSLPEQVRIARERAAERKA